jgi:threonine dehydratase
MSESYVRKILNARVYDVISETPLTRAKFLSTRFENNIQFKREDLTPVFSFKIRGAYNKMALLSEADRRRGVIAASAGNHAQGLALSAQHLGVTATIVMPKTTPQIKVNSVKAMGAKVILHGDTYDQANDYSKQLVEQQDLVYIHPFDDEDVIAGQGTVAMELLRQHCGPIDRVFIPVGGGGLCAGMAAYIKYLRPETRVIAVEAEDSACLKAAMEHGSPITLEDVGIFADGVAVATIGSETFRILKDLVDDVITVTTDEICAAVKDIFDDARCIVEPAGALSTAGMKKYIQGKGLKNEALVAILSGANVNFDRLRHVSERTEIGEHREAILAVQIPEQPGSFKRFIQAIGERSITEFNYRINDPFRAQIFVGVSTIEDEERQSVIDTLTEKNYPVVDLSDNEMAKLHIRHMVGGCAAEVSNELVYRFVFPERPGALMKFLVHLGHNWNISMFHYRNHGAAYGRALVGLDVPQNEKDALDKYLQDLGYQYWEETANDAYRLFMT